MKIFGFELRKVEKRVSGSIENPNVPLTADNMRISGGLSSTGELVSVDKALSLSAIWKAAFLLSGSFARVPCNVYRRVEGGKAIDASHPAYNLLKYEPNMLGGASVFKKTLVVNAMLNGNGYAYIQRASDRATPIRLVPLDPSAVMPIKVNNEAKYWVFNAEKSSKPVLLDWYEVFHLRGFGTDGLNGLSLVQFACEALGLNIAARKYGSRYFKNDAKPGTVIEFPSNLTDEQFSNFKRRWNETYQGSDNAHKMGILEGGGKISQTQINARDSQLIETMKFSIVDISNFTGIPQHKLGDTSRNGYNSLEAENQSFLDEAVDPWLIAFEEEARAKLLTEAEKRNDSHIIEFNRAALLRADLAARSIYYQKALSGLPWMTANEVRAIENMNPVDGFSDIRIPTNNFGDKNGDSKNG